MAGARNSFPKSPAADVGAMLALAAAAARSFVFFLALFFSTTLHAATARGSLSTTNATVGERVEFEITTEDGSPDKRPQFPAVDGLELNAHVGQSSQTMFGGGEVRHTTTYSYSFTPRREGTFTIPAIEVVVDGKRLVTTPVTLKVAPASATVGAGDMAFGEVLLARKTAYVGEDLPVEMRYHFDLSMRWQWREAPSLSADGFTARRIVQGSQSQLDLAGKQYGRVPFRSTITPARAGKITVGPATLQAVYSKAGRSRYDPFGLSLTPGQEISVVAPAVELMVRPLPVEGRPRDFSGGIGSFRMESRSTPARVKFGDPVTVTLSITGQGNFDRLGAPALAEPEGWRTYPPADRFEEPAQPGGDGMKTFEFAVVPETAKNTTPVFSFSYFDPAQEKYVTLKSEAAPLVVEGAPAVAPVPAAVALETKPAAPAPPAEDLRGIMRVQSFVAPAWMQSPLVMFGVMFAPLPFVIGLLVWRLRREDTRGAELRRLRAEKAAQLARVRSATDRIEAVDAAMRVLQIEAAFRTGAPPAAIGQGEITGARRLDTDTAARIEELFAMRAELAYAGGVRGGSQMSAAERDRLIETLAAYERSAKA